MFLPLFLLKLVKETVLESEIKRNFYTKVCKLKKRYALPIIFYHNEKIKAFDGQFVHLEVGFYKIHIFKPTFINDTAKSLVTSHPPSADTGIFNLINYLQCLAYTTPDRYL